MVIGIGSSYATELSYTILCEDNYDCEDPLCECTQENLLDEELKEELNEETIEEKESDLFGLSLDLDSTNVIPIGIDSVSINPFGINPAAVNPVVVNDAPETDISSFQTPVEVSAPIVQYDAIDYFIIRLYAFALGRGPDHDGFQHWKNVFLSGATGGAVAYNFIFSHELTSRNLCDSSFLDVLYITMLGRHADADGKAYWMNKLASGVARTSIFGGFDYSQEFIGLCRAAGIAHPGTFLFPSSNNLVGRVIFLDAGHGTVGSPGVAGYNEAVTMLSLARRIKPLLEAHGATVVLTRDSETNIPIATRCAIINIRTLEAVRSVTSNASQIAEINRLISVMQDVSADPFGLGTVVMNLNPHTNRGIHPDLQRIFEYQNHPIIRNNFLSISLHSNATANGDTGVRGAEVYFVSPSLLSTQHYFPGYSYSSESRRFADVLLNNISHAGIPRRENGLRAANYAMIREINIPAVLAENGFHTNPADRALLQNPDFLNRLANAYLNAILGYFS
jgi:N-acetylmuramoyl-L-alanine amidase